jgi:ribosome maturation protein Sdo1
VLQIGSVFMNVSKGIVAKKEDLKQCFGTEDPRTVILEVRIESIGRF